MDSPFPKEFKATFDFKNGIWTGDSMVGDEDIKELTEKHSVKGLYLKRADITGKGIKYLKNEPLENLRLQFLVLTPSILDEISKLSGLKTLCVYFTESINDKTIIHLNGPEGLTYLNLTFTRIGDRGLEHIYKTYPNLESLCISQCENLTDDCWPFIGKVKTLTGVSAYGVCFEDQAVKAVKNLSNLTSLGIGGPSITDRTMLNLSLPKLRLTDLTIKNGMITDKTVFSLAKIKSLKRVRLENCSKLTGKSRALARKLKRPAISIVTSKEAPKSLFRNKEALEELVKD